MAAAPGTARFNEKTGRALRLRERCDRLPLLVVLALYTVVVLRCAWISDDAYALTREIHLTTLTLSAGLSVLTVLLYAGGLAPTALAATVGVTISLMSKAFVDYSTSGLDNPLAHLLLVLYLLVLVRRAPTPGRLVVPVQNPMYPTIAGQTSLPMYANRTDGYGPGNAWYDGGSINFCSSSGSYPHTVYSSVVLHECGHRTAQCGGSRKPRSSATGAFFCALTACTRATRVRPINAHDNH